MRATRRGVLAGIGGLGLAGCVATPGPRAAGIRSPLPPLRMEIGRLTHITVCLRPFRAAGPRLEVENIGAKRVVHNYGHGGSGWSLSWGSAALAARAAMADGARDVAVIGCGAIGLTTAITLQRAGARVVIHARERLPQSRSARATGTWSPDSRVADAARVTPAFPALWEAMARHTFAAHQTYVGLAGEPVAWTDRYTLLDDTGGAGAGTGAEPAPAPAPAAQQVHFADYGDRLRDIVPRSRALAGSENPFPVDRVRHGVAMQFNIAALGQRLLDDFLLEGGRIETTEFDSPADFARLAQPVIVNCTGYGARALMGDESIVPVRGQIAWLAAQPEARYGLYYRSVSVLPRTDGVVVQYLGDSDMFGYGIADETPDRAEAERAIATVAGLFAAPG